MAFGDLLQTLGVDPLTGQSNLASPDAVKRQRDLAAALGKEGMNYSPIQSPWQGAARLAQALSGGIDDWRANKTEAAGRASDAAQRGWLADLLSGQTATPATTPAPSPVASADGGDTQPAATGADVSKFLPTFAQASGKYGISPEYLARTAQIESSGNPNASNPSGAAGLMQFMPSTAKAYGLSDPFNPIASIDAGARLAADNKASLSKALGRDPTDAELYLAHQQGAGGASKLLSNPDAPAASIVGRAAVVQNGGTPNMTAGQFANLWLNKFGNSPSPAPSQATAFAGPQPTQEGDPTMPPMPPVRPASLGGQGASAIAADNPEDVPAEGAAPVARDTPSPAPAAAPAAAVDPQKRARIQSLMAVMANPWASAATQQLAASILQKEFPEKKQPISVAAGSSIVDPTTGRVIYTSPKDAADKTPSSIQEYEYAKKNGFEGSLSDWKQLGGGKDGNHVLAPGGKMVDRTGKVLAQNDAQSGGARSAIGLYMRKFMDENPNATAEEIQHATQGFAAGQSGYSRFTSGPQGNTVRSFNVLVDHLGTLNDAATALKNGDIKSFNSLAQRYAEQTGQTPPTNFDATKALVGDEIIKAIVGSQGTLADREEVKTAISRANSPAQLAGVIDQYRRLAVGQLHGLKHQYEISTGRNDFEKGLMPGTRKFFEGVNSHTGGDGQPPAAEPGLLDKIKPYLGFGAAPVGVVRYDAQGNKL